LKHIWRGSQWNQTQNFINSYLSPFNIHVLPGTQSKKNILLVSTYGKFLGRYLPGIIILSSFPSVKRILVSLTRSVVDPYSFFTDPDPEYDVGDQYGSGSNTDPGL
jgi:hypothetical protein